MSEDLSNLSTNAYDWSAWDDTYAFIEDVNEEYLQSNLTNDTVDNDGLRLNLMLFANVSREIVYIKKYNLGENHEGEYIDADGNIVRSIVQVERLSAGGILNNKVWISFPGEANDGVDNDGDGEIDESGEWSLPPPTDPFIDDDDDDTDDDTTDATDD